MSFLVVVIQLGQHGRYAAIIEFMSHKSEECHKKSALLFLEIFPLFVNFFFFVFENEDYGLLDSS